MRTVNIDSLRIAIKHYYYKPVQALFSAFEVEEYLKTGLRLKSPSMDLGCGDGIFGSILQQSGIVNSTLVSLDISLKDLMAGKKNNNLPRAIQADIRNLPLRRGSLCSVFSNDVLCCLSSESDIDCTLSEVHEVLQDQGLFFVSVPTPHFNENLRIPKMLTKAGMPAIARYYLLRLNRRLHLRSAFYEAIWREKLEAAGFNVDQVRYYFTPRQASWWSILSLHFFRVFALLRMLAIRSQRLSTPLEMLFRPVFEQERSVPQAQKQTKAGYLLFVARKLAN